MTSEDPMPTPDQKTDHREEAKRLVGWLGEPDNPAHRSDSSDWLTVATALVHSNLAIAEELEGIREALVGRVEGTYRQALDEIAGLAIDEGEPDDNKVRERVWGIAAAAVALGDPDA
jgi:hypothetical protein